MQQIWDFNLGRTRDHNESSQLEIGYGTNNAGFMIKSHNDLLKENAFSTTNILEDIYDIKCASANEDVLSTNIHHMPSQNVSYHLMFICSKFSIMKNLYDNL